MGIKQRIKRGTVKAHRKVFGKPTFVRIDTSKGGLTKSEILEVLQTLANAARQGKIAPNEFEYKPPIPALANREPLYIIPEDGNVNKLRVQLKGILGARYGSQFSVDGGFPKNREVIANTQGKSVLPGGRGVRITPKMRRLR